MVLQDEKKKSKKDPKVTKSEENEEATVTKDKKKSKKKPDLAENGEKEEATDIKEKKKSKKDKTKADKSEEVTEVSKDSVVKEKKKTKKDKTSSANGHSVTVEADMTGSVNGTTKIPEETKNGAEVPEKTEAEILGDFSNFRISDVTVEKLKSKCAAF